MVLFKCIQIVGFFIVHLAALVAAGWTLVFALLTTFFQLPVSPTTSFSNFAPLGSHIDFMLMRFRQFSRKPDPSLEKSPEPRSLYVVLTSTTLSLSAVFLLILLASAAYRTP